MAAEARIDYDALAAGLSQAIPFNVHLGLRTTTIAPDRGVVVLPDDERLRNHVGSQHAGGLFAAAEAASGAAFVGAFAPLMGEITPLAESAEIAYRKLAQGEIVATASFEQDREALIAELKREGRVRFPIAVQLTDAEGNLVAEVTVRWYVRHNQPAPASARAAR